MTNLLIVGIPFIAGIAIGAGFMLIAVNKRLIRLDPVRDQFTLDEQDLKDGDNSIKIGITDRWFGGRVAEVTLLKEDQNERVGLARWMVDALNHYKEPREGI